MRRPQQPDQPQLWIATNRISRRSLLLAGTAVAVTAPWSAVTHAQRAYRRIAPQFIAALGAPDAHAGNDAQRWGLWRRDPGPRGVRLDHYGRLAAAGGIAPAQWQFDANDWWLEEHGLIMEQPEFPLPPGQYLVTGDRDVTAGLTVAPQAADGTQAWRLDSDATIYDVTHLRCRSARYTPADDGTACSPTQARQSAFPVSPGAEMPAVADCHKQDYAVLIVVGLGSETA